jgi:hypothetical protein
VEADHRRARYMSGIAAWWARRPVVDPPGKRTWLVLTVVVAAFAVLASALLWQTGRMVLELPVSHGGGAQPLPWDTANSGYTQRMGSNGWYLVSAGGWTGDGCKGQMAAMPMSGDPNRDDLNNVILWWFTMQSRPRCAIEVYVPNGPHRQDAAGAPATYLVYDTTDGSGSPIGQFGIDQVHNQGRWVAAGTFPATSGQLSVRLMSRGKSDIPGAHLGGSAVRVSC